MKYLSISVVLGLIITFFSQYSLAELVISEDQKIVLDTLPADQRESVLDKMHQSSELAEELEILEILPIIMDNELQFLMPYKINID